MLGYGLRVIETVCEEWRAIGFRDAMATLVKSDEADALTERGFQAAFETEYHCDAFYMVAHRVFDLARISDIDRGVSELRFNARGVVLVRNHLIAHPEKKNGVIPYSFGAGGGVVGPVYKSARDNLNDSLFIDPGLIPNALEFAGNLAARLRAFPRPA